MAGWRSPLHQDPDYYEKQAEQAERFADRLPPTIGGKFRQLAEGWRRKASGGTGQANESVTAPHSFEESRHEQH